MTECLKILVVEDNEDISTAFGLMLELLGHQVLIANAAKEAFALARSWPPDIVLMDISLPIMDGYKICERLRRETIFNNTRFISITGLAQADHARRSAQAGFHCHLVKPVKMGVLQSAIEKVSTEARSQRPGEPEMIPLRRYW